MGSAWCPPSGGPLLIGERLNAEGSRRVKRLLLAGDLDGLLEIGRQQIAAGAHALDVCVAIKGDADEGARFAWLVPPLAALGVPLALDSPHPEAILAALPYAPGPVILNSLSLSTPTPLADALVAAAIERAAPLVVLCRDEQGLATTPERKREVARRVVTAVEQRGLPMELLLVDPVVLPNQGQATVDGIRAIREAIPGVRMVAGISDVSFGLPPAERPAVNAAFFHACVESGLDAAILNVDQVSGLGVRAPEARSL